MIENWEENDTTQVSSIEKALRKAKASLEVILADKLETPPTAAAKPEPQVIWTTVMEVDQARLRDNRVVSHLSDTIEADAYKALRTQLIDATLDKGHNTVFITSPMPGEGKTLTSLNLALTISLTIDQSVLLVEADLRAPSLAGMLGVKFEKGLANYLADDVPIRELLINPGMAKLTILPAGRPLSGSTEFLSSSKMASLMAELKTRYPDRYVIVDGPPLLVTPDALALSAQVDAVILVVETNKTRKEWITQAIDLLKGRNLLGLVLNKAPLHHTSRRRR
ncbi:MAG: AAA family ATPase [Pseudomonadota bacterium]